MTAVEALAGFEFLAVDVHAIERGLGFGHFVAETAERELDQRADRFFVIDNQDAAGAVDDRADGARRLDRHFDVARAGR